MSKLIILITILAGIGLAACDNDKDEPMLLGEKLTSQTLSEAKSTTRERTPSEE